MGKEAVETESAERKTEITPKTQPQKEMKKRFKGEDSKLVVSAEVSREIWDALEKRVESGEFKSRSDIVRAALDRFLRS